MKNKKKPVKKRKNNKKKKQENKTLKIITLIGIAIGLIAFVIYIIENSDGNHILKSEYAFNEPGYLDKIEVTLKKVNYINNKTGIELTFEMTNRTKNTITIVPDEYFKFYDINEVQMPNKYTENTKIIKTDETIIYKLQYDVTDKEIYEIYFYSQVVENNIKFSFTSSDIADEIVTEETVTPEKKTKD